MIPKVTVDIVTPVYYGSAEVLRGSIEKLHAFCRAELRDYWWKIIIANNGPRKDILPIAEVLSREYDAVFVLDYDLPGRGGALRSAWGKSSAQIVMYMDVDLSADLTAIPQALDEIRAGWDVVVGSRYLKESRCKRSLYRHVISRIFNHLVLRHYLRVSFSDVQCGFKALSKEAAAVLLPFTHDNGWFFDTELLYMVHRFGLKCKEIPLIWRDYWPSGVRIGQTTFDFLRKIVKLHRVSLDIPTDPMRASLGSDRSRPSSRAVPGADRDFKTSRLQE
ncbi:glycosyltransferase [Nitrospinae bacterium AH_259_B05_G02_I21]|nr:glycosyltransferase [Nitrospinae bacterium AH_259_B05_G02_I21]MDA2931634.1 glycosyltransferase [Nitrospinae bacterium AH-259-F20]